MLNLILLEDEAVLRQELTEFLGDCGYRVSAVADLASFHASYIPTLHHIAIIDLGLPDGDGMALVRALRAQGRQLGMALGQGADVDSAQQKIGQVVEGYRNTKEVRELAARVGVEMPITEEIYQVLYCGKNAREAALTLLGRTRKDERNSG